jgi:hypothetical protein
MGKVRRHVLLSLQLKKPGIFVLEQIIQSGCESGIFLGSSIIDMDAGNPFGKI